MRYKAFEPELDVSAFPRSSVYLEYLTDDARLVMANIRAGVQARRHCGQQVGGDWRHQRSASGLRRDSEMRNIRPRNCGQQPGASLMLPVLGLRKSARWTGSP